MSTIDPTQIDTTRPPDGSGDPNSPVNYTSAEERANRTDIQGQFQAAKDDVEALEASKADTTYVDAGDAATLQSATDDLSAHKANASGTEHPEAQNGLAGFVGPLNGDPNTFWNGAGAYTVPPTAGEANTQTNVGGGVEIGAGKVGVDHQLRTLNNDDGTISYVQTATGVTIRASLAAGAGTIRQVRQNSGADVSDGRARLNFIDGSGLTWDITDNAGGGETNIVANVTSAGGEANTSSNAGGGVGLALTKVGFDLPFRSLLGDSMIAIASGANTADFSLNDGSITAAKLTDAYTLQSTFAAHQGAGGAEHAAATTGAAGFMSGADKTKLEGITDGAEPNVINSWNGRTDSNIVPSSGDYTAAQVSGALGTNISSTMSSAAGHAATTRTVASGGTFTPNPLEGQFVSLSGVSATTIGSMAQNGFMVIEVPEAVSITLDPSWNNETSPKVGRASLLQLARVGTTLTAEYA